MEELTKLVAEMFSQLERTKLAEYLVTLLALIVGH